MSAARFADGLRYGIEIPSVECLRALAERAPDLVEGHGAERPPDLGVLEP